MIHIMSRCIHCASEFKKGLCEVMTSYYFNCMVLVKEISHQFLLSSCLQVTAMIY